LKENKCFFKTYLCFLLVCFVFSLSVFAQDGDKAIPLKNILLSIEKQHHVVFNYIDTEINSFKMISPKETLTLEEKLII